MSQSISEEKRTRWPIKSVLLLVTLALLFLYPSDAFETAAFVVDSLIEVTPLIVPGVLLAAWISASGASTRVADTFGGNLIKSVVAASAVGAITPVCGVTVLPLMIGLLAAGVPLAPVMAFWLASPVTDPAMLAATLATLGFEFAVGKTLAAFGLGILGGAATAVFATRPWVRSALRDNTLVGSLGKVCQVEGLCFRVWMSAQRRQHFFEETISTTRLILICLVPAFIAEFLLNSLLEPEILSGYLGSGNAWAIPLAVIVGAPAYLDGYAALPLTRAFMDHGMSPGAAMAFLVSGGAVSIWGALAIFPVLKFKPFLLYLLLAVTGSMIAGWIFDFLV